MENHNEFYNHVQDESYLDYYSHEKRHKRAVDYVNGKPGISPGLRRLLIVALCLLIGALLSALVYWLLK